MRETEREREKVHYCVCVLSIINMPTIKLRILIIPYQVSSSLLFFLKMIATNWKNIVSIKYFWRGFGFSFSGITTFLLGIC